MRNIKTIKVMRLSLLVAMLSIGLNVTAQKKSTTSTIDMSITKSEYKKKYKSSLIVTDSLILRSGQVIYIGQDLVLGESSNKSSEVYRYILGGKIVSTGVSLLLGHQPSFLNTMFSNTTWEVTKIKVVRNMGGINFYVEIRDKEFEGSNLAGGRYAKVFKGAFESLEVVDPNAPMTREEAISKLKESKDLYELGVITESEYEELRSKLVKLISKQ